MRRKDKKEIESVLNFFKTVIKRNDLTIRWADIRCDKRFAIYVGTDDDTSERLTSYMTSKEWGFYIEGINFACGKLKKYIRL